MAKSIPTPRWYGEVFGRKKKSIFCLLYFLHQKDDRFELRLSILYGGINSCNSTCFAFSYRPKNRFQEDKSFVTDFGGHERKLFFNPQITRI